MARTWQLIGVLGSGIVLGTAVAAPLNILGFDDMSCAAWQASREDADRRISYVVWIRRIQTGHNYGEQSKQVSRISRATIQNFVNRYCTQNPNGQFRVAAFRLSDEFSGRNQPIRK